MGELLNKQQTNVQVTSWDRSWRNDGFTDYATDFSIRFYMETITCDDKKNKISSVDKGVIERKMSEVKDDPDVQIIKAAMTRLMTKWQAEDEAKAQAEKTILDNPIVP